MDSDIVAIRPARLRFLVRCFRRGEKAERGGLADEVAGGRAEDGGGEDIRGCGGRGEVAESGHWVGVDLRSGFMESRAVGV